MLFWICPISGYVTEKSLYQHNSLAPHLRHRINDDLSYSPAPYRILRSMLMAPGMLSGYNFLRQKTESGESGTEHLYYNT